MNLVQERDYVVNAWPTTEVMENFPHVIFLLKWRRHMIDLLEDLSHSINKGRN